MTAFDGGRNEWPAPDAMGIDGAEIVTARRGYPGRAFERYGGVIVVLAASCAFAWLVWAFT